MQPGLPRMPVALADADLPAPEFIKGSDCGPPAQPASIVAPDSNKRAQLDRKAVKLNSSALGLPQVRLSCDLRSDALSRPPHRWWQPRHGC